MNTKKIYTASRKSPSVVSSPKNMSIQVTLEANAVVYKVGVLTKRVEEIPYNKINSINIKQSLSERVLGYGDVVIITGNDVNGIVLKDIDNPQALKSDIMERVQGVRAGANKENDDNLSGKLEELAALKEKGIITQDEFDAKKKHLLGL